MVAATTAPVAPGELVVTETCGGTISGYCPIGIEYSASAPAIVVTMAMTMASRGRSTKTEDSIKLASDRLRHRACSHRYSGTDPLQAVHDDLLAAGQPGVDHDIRAALGAGLDALDDGLAILDDEDIDAPLVGDERSLRDDHLFVGGAALEIDPHQLAIDRPAVGIRYRGAGDDGIGGTIYRHIDEIDLAQVVVSRAIRESNLYFDVLGVGGAAGLSGLQEFALAYREGDIH